MSENKETLNGSHLNFNKFYYHGAVIDDDPAACTEKLNDLCERLRITEFALWTNIAGMPAKESMAAMLLIMNDLVTCVNAMKAAR